MKLETLNCVNCSRRNPKRSAKYVNHTGTLASSAARAGISGKQASSRVSSLFGPSSLWKQVACHVSGRPGLQETGEELDRDSVATTLLTSQSRGKRNRELNYVHALRDRDNLQKILERRVDLAVRGEREREAQQKLYQAEGEVEVRNWEKRNSDVAFREVSQEFESQRFQLHQASRWADLAQRDNYFVWRIGIEK